MFSVKAQYSGETRRFSFDLDCFPSFGQLTSQCLALFPISPNFTLSELSLCPDSSRPAHRVPVGHGPIFCASQYALMVAPFANQRWTNALLRFTIQDEGLANSTNVSDYHTPRPMPSQPHVNPLIPRNFASDPSHDTSSDSRRSLGPQPPQFASSCNEMDDTITEFVAKMKLDLHNIVDKARLQACPTDTESCPSSRPSTSVGNAAIPCGSRPSLTQPCGPTCESTYCRYCMKDYQGSSFFCTGCGMKMCLSCATRTLTSCNAMRVCHDFRMEDCGCSQHQSRQTSFSPLLRTTLDPLSTGPPTPKVAFGSSTAFPSMKIDGSSPPDTSERTPGTLPKINLSHNSVPFHWGIGPSHHQSFSSAQSSSMDPVLPSPAPQPESLPVHHRIKCDSCDQVVVGVRHKCLDCPDFDLCSACIARGAAEGHNPFHEFFEITEPGHVIVHTVFSGSDEGALIRSPAISPEHHPVPPSPPASMSTTHLASCDLCDSAIRGARYKCQDCPDFDTCSSCFAIVPEQHPNHVFIRIHDQADYIEPTVRRRDCVHFATCDSCRKPITGTRYKCLSPECPDFDLCSRCEALPIAVHPDAHPLLKMKSPTVPIPPSVSSRRIVVGNCSAMRPEPPTSGYSVAGGLYPPESLYSTLFRPESPNTAFPYHNPDIESICSGKLLSGNDQPQTASLLSPLPPLNCGNVEAAAPPSPGLFGPKSPPCTVPYHYQDVDEPSNPLLGLFGPRSRRGSVHHKNPGEPSQQSFSSFGTTDLFHGPVSQRGDPGVPSPLQIRDDVSDGAVTENDLEHVLDLPSPPTNPPVVLDLPPKLTLTLPQLAFYELGTQASTGLGSSSKASDSQVPKDDMIVPLPQIPKGTPYLPSVPEQTPVHLKQNRIESVTNSCFPLDQASTHTLQATFLADITVPEGQVLPPGCIFRKTWRLRNSGSQPWPTGVALHFIAGSTMAFDPEPILVGSVAPGRMVDVTTRDLMAPDIEGRYVSYWRLRDDRGELFGQSFWIDIFVQGMSSTESSVELSSSSVIMPSGPLNMHSPSAPITRSPSSPSLPDSELNANFSDALSDLGSDTSIVSFGPQDMGDWDPLASPLPSQNIGQPVEEEQNPDYIVLFDDTSSEE